MSAADKTVREIHIKTIRKCTTEQLSLLSELVNTKGAMAGIVENKELLLNALGN